MLDTSAIGAMVADTMLELEERHETGTVRSVAIVVEVDDGEGPTKWSAHGPDDRRWLTRVVLEMGLGALDDEGDRLILSADEDE